MCFLSSLSHGHLSWAPSARDKLPFALCIPVTPPGPVTLSKDSLVHKQVREVEVGASLCLLHLQCDLSHLPVLFIKVTLPLQEHGGTKESQKPQGRITEETWALSPVCTAELGAWSEVWPAGPESQVTHPTHLSCPQVEFILELGGVGLR